MSIFHPLNFEFNVKSKENNFERIICLGSKPFLDISLVNETLESSFLNCWGPSKIRLVKSEEEIGVQGEDSGVIG